MCSVLQVSIVLLASAKRLFLLPFLVIYMYFFFFIKYPNFFSTGYGILKLDVKTKSQSGVVSITVVTGCV